MAGFRQFLKRKMDQHGGPLGLAQAVATKPYRMMQPKDQAEVELEQRVEALRKVGTKLPDRPDAEGYRAIGAAELVQEGKPATFVVSSEVSVAVYRYQGRLYGVDHACTHEDGPLGESQVEDGGVITCPYHDWKFRLADGACITDPSRPVGCYRLKERDGLIWLGPAISEGSKERGGEHDDGMEMV